MHYFKCTLLLILSVSHIYGISLRPTAEELILKAAKKGEPYQIPLRLKQRTSKQKDHLFSLVQTERIKMKPFSFLQKEGDDKEITLSKDNEAAKVALQNIMNTQYIGDISVGDKNDVFQVVYDTGSTPFFINSELCKDTACQLRNQYNLEDQDSLHISEPEMGMTVVYGSGQVDGLLVKEDVFVGNAEAKQMPLFLINDQDGVLDYGEFDGVVGLGFSQTTNSGLEIKSVFDLVKNEFPQPYFSFGLKRNEDMGSYVMFGGYQKEDISSPLVWHDVIDTTYWMLPLSNFLVGGEPIELCQQRKCGVIIDSGTSIMTAPSMALFQMDGLAGDTSCFDMANLPPIAFQINDHHYELSPDEYIVTTNLLGDPEFYTHSTDFIDCSGLFTPMSLTTADGNLVFILGDVFFSRYYAVFDAENRRIGLAPQNLATASEE